MNDSPINTNKNENCCNNCDISNVYSFTSFSGGTSNKYTSTSTSCTNKKLDTETKNNISNFYSINLDWFQFICHSEINNKSLELYTTSRIKFKKQQTNHNPNFKFRYIVYLDDIDLCEIFTIPNNRNHKQNEISVKMINSQLYSTDWVLRIQYVINNLGLVFSRLTKIDIALDGNDIYKKMGLFRRYLRTKTIQISNKGLKVEGDHFIKEGTKWGSYTIGSRKYQKTAKIYVKTEELKASSKQYIKQFWEANGLDTNNTVGRFELQLGTRHLRKYKVNSLHDFCDAGFLGKIIFEEVHDWLKFYQVSLQDAKKHRKDIAIKHGKEKPFLIWHKLPKSTIQLEKIIIPRNGIHEAKRAITYTISKINKGNNVSCTDTFIKFVEVTTTEHGLHSHSIAKVKAAIRENPTDCKYLNHLLKILNFNLEVL